MNREEMKSGAAMPLTPPQLCDLLNYVLGLPRKLGTRTVLHHAIDPCVVRSWPRKRARLQAEKWCEARLREAGVLRMEAHHPGRPVGRVLPREAEPWRVA